MKTKNLLLIVGLVLLGGVMESKAQVFLGTGAGAANPTSVTNNGIGFNSLNLNFATGAANVGVGNVGLGYQTLAANVSGADNTAIGTNVLVSNSGSLNTAIGSNCFSQIGAGSQNVGLGYYAGRTIGSGNYNVFIGDHSGVGFTNTTSGNNNTFLGYYSGRFITSGDSNLLLGNYAGPLTPGAYSNKLYINSGPAANNTPLIYGDFYDRTLRFYTNVNAASKVEITSFGAGTSGLKFTNLPNTSTSITNPTTKVLSVNAAGDVILVNDIVGLGGTCNLYSCDDTINTITIPSATLGVRTVTMGNNNLFFKTNNVNDGNGRVYIGGVANFPTITATSQFRLLVEGGILTERVKVALRNTTNWADYVFAKDYKLMPLNEVESFLKENKHLPGIDSATDLVKKGVDLGEMQAKQMGKIEELTLYVIEQGKEIEELKAQVKALLKK